MDGKEALDVILDGTRDDLDGFFGQPHQLKVTREQLLEAGRELFRD